MANNVKHVLDSKVATFAGLKHNNLSPTVAMLVKMTF